MALTPTREAFCLAYIKDKVATKAYVASHDASRMKPATIRKRAAELLKVPEVQARIAELQSEVAKVAVIDRADVLQRLERVVRMSMGDEPVRKVVLQGRGKDKREIEVEAPMIDLRAACRALELIGKSDEVKLFIERHEHSGKDGAPLLGEVAPRDVARAVLDILRTAKLAEAPRQDATGDDDEAAEEPDEEQDGGLASRGSSAAVGHTAAVRVAHSGRQASPGSATTPSPRPQPEALAPGEREVTDSGAEITFATEFRKYAVHDAAGRLHGYRPTLAAARELASRVKPLQEQEPQ